MKGRILKSEYNPGYDSWVLKATKYGTFDGQVFIDDEDLDIDNSFDGCRIAEFDADLKAYKEKAKWMRQRALGIETAFNNLCQIYDFDLPVMNSLRQQVYVAFKEADKAKEYCERMKDYRPIMIKNLATQRREFRKKHEE